MMMNPSIIFIHWMFLTGKSWVEWGRYFETRGYRALAPSWPLHAGEPSELRARVPVGLGRLGLDEVVAHYIKLINVLPERPVLIGHSVGGLIVQRLIAAHMGRAGVCISSVAPNAMVSLDWGFLRNSALITNPLKGDAPFEMTPEGFHKNFANTMTREVSDRAYEEFVVHESRNVLRDCLGKAGEIDLERPHAPLLFIAGDRDRIIPDKLNERNARAYTHKASVADFVEFRSRGHFICGQPGWEKIAEHVAEWLTAHAQPALAA